MAEHGSIIIGGHEVRQGTTDHFELPIGRLVTGTDMALPVRVVHGAKPGPTAWLNAAIHGDEVGGVEVITRVLRDLDPMAMRGTVLAVPVVNVWGFMGGDRFLPDRRDLNRSFPGSPSGSLAAQIAHLFMTEVVGRSVVASTSTRRATTGRTCLRSGLIWTTRRPGVWPRPSVLL